MQSSQRATASVTTMSSPDSLPACPYLPCPDHRSTWRGMHALRDDRGIAFYMTALRWGQSLWLRNLPARSLLALDRALFARLSGHEPALRDWPLPYAAVGWIVAHASAHAFLGNPRVHYQHLADRVSDAPDDVRRWRAWACWAIVRAARPDLERDRRHGVREPTAQEIVAALNANGIPGEALLFEQNLDLFTSASPDVQPEAAQAEK